MFCFLVDSLMRELRWGQIQTKIEPLNPFISGQIFTRCLISLCKVVIEYVCSYAAFNYFHHSCLPGLSIAYPGDQKNMAVFFWYLVKVTCQVYASVCFPRYQKNTSMFNWSPCIKVILRSSLATWGLHLICHVYMPRPIIDA